jgi:hypothetical protein
MSLCFQQKNNKIYISQRMKERYRIINEKLLKYNLKKSEIDNIIQDIFIEFCGASVIGYDKIQDKYLCKKYIKSDCILHIEIKLLSINEDETQMSIKSLIGTDEEIESFIFDFNESLQMYISSNFIKSILYRP